MSFLEEIVRALGQNGVAQIYDDHTRSNGERKATAQGWVKRYCPFHEESNPSFNYNERTGAYKCFGCDQKGNITQFYAWAKSYTTNEATTALAQLAGISVARKTPETLEEKVERYHKNLFNNVGDCLQYLQKIGISQEVARRLQLGYMNPFNRYPARLIFPIFDSDQSLLTLKKYSSHAKEKCKFEKGGKNSLYGIHQITGGRPVVLCAGEKDKCVGESHLGGKFTFVTFTGGETSLPQGEFLEKTEQALRDKHLIIAYDADEAGRTGAKKVAKALLKAAKDIYIVEWPEKFAKQFPKGDITDFLMSFRETNDACQELTEILQTAPAFMPQESQQETSLVQQSITLTVPRQCNDIEEAPSGYNKVRYIKDDVIVRPISNFIILPKQAIQVRGQEFLECEFIHVSKKKATIIFHQKDWNARKDFLSKLPSHIYWCAAKDTDIQHIKAIVGEYPIETLPGTHIFGKVQCNKEEKAYVLPEQTIGKSDCQIVYVPPPGGSPLEYHFSKIDRCEDFPKLLQQLFPLLYQLHEPEPLSCILGWFFATPFKPELMSISNSLPGHFPILNVQGTRGSGKTSLLTQMLRLFGMRGETFSCSITEFSWLKILASTNCFPVCFDEFKTSDLPPWSVSMILRLIREAYNSTTLTRGRADQTIVEYPLEAPLIVMGESTIQDSAVLERLVPISLSFTWLNSHPDSKKIFRQFRKLPLHQFLAHYLEWTLEQDIPTMWQAAKEIVAKNTAHLAPADRVADNMTTVVFGLNTMNKFASEHGAAQLEFNAKEIFEYFIDQVTEDKQARIALDDLLEKLADLAENDKLVKELDFLVEKDCLYLRLQPAIDKFKAWSKTHAYGGEILEYKAYRKMVRERTGDYIIEKEVKKRFSGRQAKCVSINLLQAGEMGISLEGFRDKTR